MTNQRSTMTYALWTVQVLLALLFLFAGVMKLVMPVEAMTKEMHFAGAVAPVYRRGRSDGGGRPGSCRDCCESARA